ncbi:MAG: hypothetical protein C3F13_13020 [Anaerolineales bacterium]|nr:MAG: hypothetical protein C3F13_13020 [Anaerolineales bacterium]
MQPELTSSLRFAAEGQLDTAQKPVLLPITHAADQADWLVYRPRRLLLPRSWTLLTPAAYLLPGLTDRLVASFLPKKKRS